MASDPDPFATTHWSLVLRAGQSSPDARAALADLCGRYWYPLYAYVRRRVADVHEAQDLTQAFFARLLEKGVLERAAPERGRFRAFLLTSLKHFLANERERERTQKRGGGQSALRLDLEAGESRLRLEPTHEQTPERVYERQWALTLLGLVLDRLRDEQAAAGKSRHFALLQESLTGERASFSYAAVAEELGISEAAARQAGHRLRKRYRELLRAEIAQTVADPAEIDEEIRGLFGALGA